MIDGAARTWRDEDGGRRPATGPIIKPPILPRERGRQKLAGGVPLLHGETLDPDWAFCRRRFVEAAGDAGLEIGAEGRLDIGRVLEEALVGHVDHLARLASWAGVAEDLLTGVAEEAVRPSLRAVAVALRPLLDSAGGWGRAYCPVCGASLDDGPAGRVQCRRCASGWTLGGSAADGDRRGFRIELAEPEPDEALEALLEMD